MNIMNELNTVGLNSFAVVLVAESLLRSPVAAMSADEKPLTFFMPINRGGYAGWVGVEFTLKAVRAEPPSIEVKA